VRGAALVGAWSQNVVDEDWTCVRAITHLQSNLQISTCEDLVQARKRIKQERDRDRAGARQKAQMDAIIAANRTRTMQHDNIFYIASLVYII
jgi:hypothetical protein